MAEQGKAKTDAEAEAEKREQEGRSAVEDARAERTEAQRAASAVEAERTGYQRGWPDDETRQEVLGKVTGQSELAERNQDQSVKATESMAATRAADATFGSAPASTVDRQCDSCGVRGPHDVLGAGDGPGMSKLRCQACGFERDGRLNADERG